MLQPLGTCGETRRSAQATEPGRQRRHVPSTSGQTPPPDVAGTHTQREARSAGARPSTGVSGDSPPRLDIRLRISVPCVRGRTLIPLSRGRVDRLQERCPPMGGRNSGDRSRLGRCQGAAHRSSARRSGRGQPTASVAGHPATGRSSRGPRHGGWVRRSSGEAARPVRAALSAGAGSGRVVLVQHASPVRSGGPRRPPGACHQDRCCLLSRPWAGSAGAVATPHARHRLRERGVGPERRWVRAGRRARRTRVSSCAGRPIGLCSLRPAPGRGSSTTSR